MRVVERAKAIDFTRGPFLKDETFQHLQHMAQDSTVAMGAKDCRHSVHATSGASSTPQGKRSPQAAVKPLQRQVPHTLAHGSSLACNCAPGD